MLPLEPWLSRAYQARLAGNYPEAERALRQAIELQPDSVEAWAALGVTLFEKGSVAEGKSHFERALNLEPTHLEALIAFGTCLNHAGQPEAAIELYQRTLMSNALTGQALASAATNLGALLYQQGDYPSAEEAYLLALTQVPDFFPAQFNLGIAYRAEGKLEEAVVAYQRAMRLQPRTAEVHHDLGLAYEALKRVDEAKKAYLEALSLRPNYPEAWLNLGNVCGDLGAWEEAITAYLRGLQCQPHYAELLNSLGIAYQRSHQPEAAERAFEAALALRSDYAEAWYNLGTLFDETNRPERAIDAYRTVLRISPDFLAAMDGLVYQYQLTCSWDALEEWPKRILEAVSNRDSLQPPRRTTLINPFSFLGFAVPTTPEQQLQCARHWGKQFRETPLFEHATRLAAPASRHARRLRIGYLSADFRIHAVGLTIPELFEAHDRGRFEVFAYSIGPDDKSAIRQRIERGVDRFRDLQHLSHQAIANQIHQDQIDILIDLQGYTARCRPAILALRPAPLQASYLGYPGTMAVSFIDALIVDSFVVPEGQQPYYTEELIKLSGCYQVNDSRPTISSRLFSRTECGLPEDGFVFCSFNNSYKLTQPIFEIWLDALRQVEASVLWLPAWNPLAMDNLRRSAARQGIARERIVFAPHLPIDEHLARHRAADLFLDSYPYSGHGTASNCLRMGVPLVTLTGDAMASRVAGSLLRELGLEELITTSYAEYHSRILELAQNKLSLQKVREKLECGLQRTTLFDGTAFARKLESALLEWWEKRAGSGLASRDLGEQFI